MTNLRRRWWIVCYVLDNYCNGYSGEVWIWEGEDLGTLDQRKSAFTVLGTEDECAILVFARRVQNYISGGILHS